MKKFLAAVSGILLFGYVQLAIGDQNANDKNTPSIPADVAARIQRQLELRYPLSKTTPDITDLVAAGAVLVLQKDNLVMNKVFTSGTSRSAPVQNVYENGEITQTGLLGTLGKINAFLGILGNTEAPTRFFARGEKFWVTRITTQPDGIVFQLMSDPINNARLHGTLKFPYGNAPEADQVVAQIADVLTTDPPWDPGGGANAQGTSMPDTSTSAPTAPVEDESEEIRRAAEGGEVNAMFQLGNALAQRGENVDAVRWFRQASDKGHIKAMNALGFMYEEGRGVPQNFKQAGNLYLQAMKNGNADAMVNRGLLYAKGLGVTNDNVQAYMHFLLAAAYAQDQETRDISVKLRDEIAAKLSKQQLARGQAMADKFAQKEIK
ncbi:localization factor PodJL [mine drainage metagenome]|uniref:Localization factor PodJL n=1 Tax=mine drainage metagenome TaxID=410659 RepID=A0A1J5QL09_9ZZZZ